MRVTVKHWKSLSKSKEPSAKSYQTLVTNISDLLAPAKLQFFAFLASISKHYLTAFQADHTMILFTYEELSCILDHLVRLVFKRKAIVEADTTLKKMKMTQLQNSDNHVEEQLFDVGAAPYPPKKLIDKIQVYIYRKKDQIKKKAMQEYSH